MAIATRSLSSHVEGKRGGTVDRDTSGGSQSSLGLFCFVAVVVVVVVVVVVGIRVSDMR